MSDLFHDDVPVDFIRKVWNVMEWAHWHTFQILTKRPSRMRPITVDGGLRVLPNVWLGTSVEEAEYVWRIDQLRQAPASIRFVSFEPLVGPVGRVDLTDIHWAIVGGESGPGARPMESEWVRELKAASGEQRVAFFFKQWGGAGGTVLIDPLPLQEEALKRLEPIIAICLTAACHQRSAWRYRRTFGVKVYAPEGCRAMDEAPDVHYRAGEILPGGLKAIHTPGPEQAHYAFWREPSPSVLFCPDLIMREDGGDLAFIPAEYHEDPDATRESVQRLLDLPFEVLCMDHGAPITADLHAALRKLLGRDRPVRR